MPLFAATIFASAFLLFLVQPIVAKEILPWFGGTAAVWTTCLVFFQTALLAGYAYADLVVRKLSARRQLAVHLGLLAISLGALPIIPAAHWKPTGGEHPELLIPGLLTATIGLPYFMLATTSPLLQAWFARAHPGASPYRLFALSNFASLAALVSYPFAIEPAIATHAQAVDWSIGYALFAALVALTAWRSLRTAPSGNRSLAAPAAADDEDASARPSRARHALWCALAAAGSFLLLATTQHITENIAAVPLLWIAPLTIYLATFIIAFDAPRWYARESFVAMAATATGIMAYTAADSRFAHELALQIGVFLAGLFVVCMFCHGELARMKPSPRHLTRFYLMVALGGALGAALVAIVAPLVLPGHFEPAFGLAICALLVLIQVRRLHWPFRALAAAALIATIGSGAWWIEEFYRGTLVATRNFYGVLRVQEYGVDDERVHSLLHGTILHGKQYLAPGERQRPTTYYTETSGVGRAIESMHPTLTPLRIGVIGLGAGTIATYGAPRDVYRFYDINPAVIGIARREFSFLGDSAATIEIAQGDARLSLEREPPQRFDLLAIDAFSSDAIPVHLITAEALQVYRRHMKPDGIIAFHVTNRFLDLIPVVEALARNAGMAATLIIDENIEARAARSDWVLVAATKAPLARAPIAEAGVDPRSRHDWRLWTDDYNNLVQVLK